MSDATIGCTLMEGSAPRITAASFSTAHPECERSERI